MISTTRSNGCGNSPKNNHVEKLTLSLSTKDFEDFKDLYKIEALYSVQFENQLKEVRLLDAFKNLMPDQIQSIVFQHSISHGKVGASWGSFKSDEQTYLFSTTIEFNNVKLSKPTVIQIFISAPIMST